ncbi:ABC transporter ATP-binding protein [Vallitalea sp.]|jgi:ATP-binding cassette subfamily B protein|uniref:ABC transporter ATP-binding protein n=1 Tax=Vallitalea sp. TaxID=1882829 RepID=UPI0025CDF72F|nr:ABC transporter ATP-binding protein [Vallitalea sp.]MCT4687732.1 ABC transporter ATP-binding protein/permease [Vallitalea sp.]
MAVNNFREDEQSKEELKKVTILRLFSYMKKYKKEIIHVLIIMGLIITVNVLNPILMKIAIDDYIKKFNANGLYIIGIIAVIMNLISRYCMKKRILIMSKVSNSVLMEIRQELYEHLQKLSFNFFDNRPVGKVLARVIGDVNSLKSVLTNSVISLVPDFVTLIVVLIIMFVLNVKLALGALALLPLLVFGMYFVQVRAHRRWQIFRKKNSNMNAYTHENFSGIRVVQSFTAEQYTSKTFRELLREHKRSFINAVRLNDIFWPMVEISWGIGTIMVFLIGVNLSSKNEITVGTLIAFTTYVGMFWQPIMNLSNFYNQLITNIAGAERIFEILDTKPDIKDIRNAKTMPSIKGNVTFNNITFGYDEKVKVLENVSFNIKEGETIALVGPTGAGKTTIVNLLSRFYDVNEGTVKIDDIDIRDVTIESLRSQMGIMTQDTFLFTGTIKDNIRYGKLDATDEEIIESAKAVHAHEFIMKLDKGYDTAVNERGTKLSVGQRQLIAFARIMLSKPKILILDEATSSIDTHTERLVQKGIEELLKNRTSFVIAHRLSTIQKANRIFVVDKGNILESGNHDELMNQEGIYYNLYMAQFEAIS